MKISQLYIYPIKSLRGAPLPTATATRTGFKYDRRFMLLKVIPANKEKGETEPTLKNMHVPHFPEMALFETVFEGPGEEDDNGGRIRVRYHNPNQEGMNGAANADGTVDGEKEVLDIPLTPSTKGLEELAITMHRSPTKGYNMGPAYNAWFSARFGYDVVLAYLGDENSRAVLGSFAPSKHAGHKTYQRNQSWLGALSRAAGYLVIAACMQRYWKGSDWAECLMSGLSSGIIVLLTWLWICRRKSSKEERITFADTAPYMVVSEKSVEDVTGRLEGEEMDVKKFRANVVVEGAGRAFEEDFWAELRIADGDPDARTKARLLLTANCVRCRSLDVDYDTGKFGTGEGGKVLKKLMADRRVDSGAKYSPVFGRYAFLDGDFEGGTVSVGDEVVVARGMEERSVHDWPGLG